MHLNNIPNTTIYLTKQSVIAFKGSRFDSMGGIAKARQFKNHSQEDVQKGNLRSKNFSNVNIALTTEKSPLFSPPDIFLELGIRREF